MKFLHRLPYIFVLVAGATILSSFNGAVLAELPIGMRPLGGELISQYFK